MFLYDEWKAKKREKLQRNNDYNSSTFFKENSNRIKGYSKSNKPKNAAFKIESQKERQRITQEIIRQEKRSPYVKNNQLLSPRENKIIESKLSEKISINKKDLNAIYDRAESYENSIKDISTENLLNLINNQSEYPPITETTYKGHKRSIFVAEFVRRKAKEICELCNEPAPFKKKSGIPYLEIHHIKWLSYGGLDTVENCVALCPNCHKKMHVVNSTIDIVELEMKTKMI